jgi:hypothetical protein
LIAPNPGRRRTLVQASALLAYLRFRGDKR